jgi:hypothetical protein
MKTSTIPTQMTITRTMLKTIAALLTRHAARDAIAVVRLDTIGDQVFALGG